MPDDRLKPLKAVIGPYESWLFENELGKSVSQDFALERNDSLAALAEVSALLPFVGMLNSSAGRAQIGGAAAQAMGPDLDVFKPQIWQPMLEAAKQDTGKPLFLPLILRSRADPERDAGWGDLRQRLADLLQPMEFLSTLPVVKPEYGVRLNGRLERGSFDQSYAGTEREPHIVADPVIKAQADKAEAAKQTPLCILAIIDDGLPFAHPALMDSRKNPRMECCWLQSAQHAPHGTGTVLFGREILREDIIEKNAACGGDEERLYREMGAIDNMRRVQPLVGRASHGAHVLSLAAGGHPADDNDEVNRVRLIGVELPPALTMDTVGFGKDAYVLAAFHYVFERADRIAKAYGFESLPLILNFSFGFTGGPHDGTDRLEAAIDALIGARGRNITHLVMPAGNHFQARLHGVVTDKNADAEGNFSIPWRIQPEDRTSNYLEIWYPPGRDAAPEWPLICGPDGHACDRQNEQSGEEPVQAKMATLRHNTYPVGQVSIDRFRGGRWRLMVILAPTESGGAPWRACPAGLWTIKTKAPAAGEGEMTCRIQRDQTVRHARHHGRQSYFDHPADFYFSPDDQPLASDDGMTFVRRFGTLNGLATHKNCEVIGGYRIFSASGKRLPATYSSAGSLMDRGADRNIVHASAPADTSSGRPGIRAAGTRAGAAGRLSGTSAAAPQAARARALGVLSAHSEIGNPEDIPPPPLQDRLGAKSIPPVSAD